MFIINFCLNMFRALLCPSSGEQRQCVYANVVCKWVCRSVGLVPHTRSQLGYYTLPHKKDITANIYLFPACYSAAHHMH